MRKTIAENYAVLLADWVKHSQRHLYTCRDDPALLCYGAGEHGHWGTHTHQKAMAAFAVAAAEPSIDWDARGMNRGEVYAQALAMLRYTLRTHVSGDTPCTDGGHWGHNWIYALGMERMMHGVGAMEERLTEADRAALRRVLLSECDWLLDDYEVKAGLWSDNRPESNIWNGAILYRTALLFPDHERAAAYRKKDDCFFINGISVPSDENSPVTYNRRAVSTLFKGANFFESFALNHHNYLNIGYMVICLSNIAMLHFAFRQANEAPPAALYHHADQLWQLVRTLTFEDGRLLRIGGDTRVRYCYCQDYALPVWQFIEDWLGEDCAPLMEGWLSLITQETMAGGDGSFLSARCGSLEALSPVYYTRLESDRAASISMALYWNRVLAPKTEACKVAAVHSSWYDHDMGAAYVAGSRRLASFVWRASENPQGLCLPPTDSSLAEWRYNLSGRVEGIGLLNTERVESHRTRMFDGGFLTYGCTRMESDQFLAEGQQMEILGCKQVAFAALPDDRTVLCLQYATAAGRYCLRSVSGIHWNVPNDLFNGQRQYISPAGQTILQGGGHKQSETIPLGWRR